METNQPSKRFTINGADIWKTVRGTLINYAGIGVLAIVAVISNEYVNWNYNVCMSQTLCMDLKFLAIPLIGGAVEIVRRFFTDLRKK